MCIAAVPVAAAAAGTAAEAAAFSTVAFEAIGASGIAAGTSLSLFGASTFVPAATAVGSVVGSAASFFSNPLLSLGFKAFGLYQQFAGQANLAKSQQALYDYQAAVSRNNMILADRREADARDRQAREEKLFALKAKRISGESVVDMIANGLDIGYGSPAAALAATDAQLYLDSQVLADNADKEVWGYRIQGVNAAAHAGQYELASDSISPTRQGISSTIGGLGSLYEDYNNWRLG